MNKLTLPLVQMTTPNGAPFENLFLLEGFVDPSADTKSYALRPELQTNLTILQNAEKTGQVVARMDGVEFNIEKFATRQSSTYDGTPFISGAVVFVRPV